jgi:hypothetical protein
MEDGEAMVEELFLVKIHQRLIDLLHMLFDGLLKV